MLDLLISFGILIICCCLLLPAYMESITIKNDFRMEETALNRLLENLNDYQVNGRSLFTGQTEIEGKTFTFYLEGDGYIAEYRNSKGKLQKVYEKLPYK